MIAVKKDGGKKLWRQGVWRREEQTKCEKKDREFAGQYLYFLLQIGLEAGRRGRTTI